MNIIDNLKVIDGYVQDDRFIMQEMAGYAITGAYRAEGLRSMARLIDNTPMSFKVDKNRSIIISAEHNKQIKKELNMIAEKLEGI